MNRRLLSLLLCLLGALPLLAESGADSVLTLARRVNDRFMRVYADPTHPTFVKKVRPSSLWTRAVYYEGLMALYAIDPRQCYLDYTDRWGAFHHWAPRDGITTTDADNQCCAQTYLERFAMTGDMLMTSSVEANLEHQMATGRYDYWTWIDAIQMAMPVYVKYYSLTGDRRYLDYAINSYLWSRNTCGGGLFNKKDGLWWRDKDYVPPYREQDGNYCYWSRGNGWVYAALLRCMDVLDKNTKEYKLLEKDFLAMSKALLRCQRADGFWNVSLHSPATYGGPEMTGTALFLYGMSWGIRHGLLAAAGYRPACDKAWRALVTCVHPDGFLGWNQGTGKDPSAGQPLSYDKMPDFEDYGTGCWLLGATEYARMMQPELNACLPFVLPEARPGTRWWWFGSAVDEAGLKYNLDALHRAGIGAVEITPIYGVQDNEAHELSYLSPAWMRALQFTERAAAADSVEVDMNNGTGWPFGGPLVPIDEAACKAFFVDTLVNSKTDIKKLTFQIPDKEKKYAKLATVRSFKTADKHRQRVIALFISRTRQRVKRAAPGGEGWVIDHFDSLAVAHYLQHIDSAFTASHTPYPHTFFNDSYEVYGANWTPRLLEEFRIRRGYDLLDSLDRFVDGDARVVCDYRETLSDLLYHNFTQQWTAWAHSHGALVRNQAHGSPANLLDLYATVDIPEIEGFGLSDFGIKGLRRDSGFTRPNFSDISMLKYAPSAAHVMGKPFTSSETFTWLTEHFRTSLSQMKPDLDLMFSCGVNHMFFHGTPYSPGNARWPGWQFYASVNMSPTNSIWRDAPWLMRYIRRCQSFLQWGDPDNDFLVVLPVKEMWKKDTRHPLMLFDIHSMDKKAPEFIRAIHEIDSLGYDCDYISERQLARAKRVGEQWITEAGTRYRGLIDLTKPIDNQALVRLAKAEPMRTQLHLRAIRRRNGMGYHYFIANLTPNDVDSYVPLAVAWHDALWYDPLTGKRYAVEQRNGQLHVALRSGESMILQTFDRALPQALAALPHRALPGRQTKELNGSWQLAFEQSAPTVRRTWTLDKPQTWETLGDDSAAVTMGSGAYTTTFRLSADEARRPWLIDLGDVRESAEVWVNGRFAGCAWSVPFTLDISGLLKKGDNTLRVVVTNLPANRIADMDRRGIPWRVMKDINVVDLQYHKTNYAGWAPVKSGLNGSVRLVELHH